MKKLAALLLCFLPSVAFGQRQDLAIFNECKPFGFAVLVQASDDDFAADAERRLSTAVETRLRAARLYDATAPTTYLDVGLIFLESIIGGERVGYASSYHVHYRTHIITDFENPSLETIYTISNWDDNGLIIGPENSQPGDTIESALESVDTFILEYLRANEAFCT